MKTVAQGVMRRFWIQQIRIVILAMTAAIGSSAFVGWLSVADVDTQVRLHARTLSFVLPGIVAAMLLTYIIRQNVKNVNMYLRVQAAANSDDLTGLPNRRAFTRLGAARLAQAREDGVQTGLMLVDIDWFKHVNDVHGHDAGDGVLRQVAETLRAAAPEGALVARLGGEEFTVLANTSGPDDLAAIAEALRKAIEAARLIYRGDIIRVTISLGLTLANPDDTLSTLLTRADKALYDAKNHGRNRFALAA